MTEFSIRRVDRKLAQSVEQLGSKPKFWFREGKRRLLFKADNRGTGEDWAEVIACHLCRLLGLPHVEYELAVECDGEQDFLPGVVCENMAPPPLTLVLGNQMLLAVDPSYPKEQRFKVKQHTVNFVSGILTGLGPPAAEWMIGVPAGIQTALDVFVGYVMLDAWIANQDRHHENWGGLWDGNQLRLAPTFDHGAALARNLRDGERQERLVTRDKRRSVDAFAAKGQSAFFGMETDKRPLGLQDAFLAFSKEAPAATGHWLEKLRAVNRDAVWGILERVPAQRMTSVCREFTLELLLANQRRLLS